MKEQKCETEDCPNYFTPTKPGRARWCPSCKIERRKEWNAKANKKRSAVRSVQREDLMCLRCNLPLHAKRSDAKYHQECAQAVSREQQAAWEKDHRLERTLRMRKRRGNNDEAPESRPLQEYICQTHDCGQVYLSKRSDSKYCPDCNYQRRLDRSSVYKLRQTYNLTVTEYLALLEKQDYKCAIASCKRSFTAFPNFTGLSSAPNGVMPHVDHNHDTGVVRGLLCAWCNTDLGHVENKQWLEDALSYLKA